MHSFSQESNLLKHSLIADILAFEGEKDFYIKEMATGIFLGGHFFSLIIRG